MVVVNPSAPVGPRDIKPTPTGKMIADTAAGRMPAYVETGLNVVHVDDVAEGHCLALERGRVGRVLHPGRRGHGDGDLLALVADVAGRRPPRVKLPHGALYPLALASEGLARLTGMEPIVTRDILAMARKKMFFSSAKARAELGYAPRPARRGGGGRGGLVPRRRPDAGVTVLALLALAVWAYLLLGHGRFWSAGPSLPAALPAAAPDLDVVVPARDEAEGDRALPALAAGAGLSRHAAHRAGGRRQHRRHRRARPRPGG